MIEYRNSDKGSYDGRKRMYEISHINVSRLSEMTKEILLYCIHANKADDLLKLRNLKGLSNVKYDEKLISKLRRGHGMKLSVNGFYEYVKRLNTWIDDEAKAGRLPDDYIFEIKCIGVFAMSYWHIRDDGMTEDMDSLVEINDAVREAIRSIANEENLPQDWINDTMLHFYSDTDFHWIEVPWFFGKNSRIRVFVCSKEDLLKNKIRLAEYYLSGEKNQDSESETDYQDAVSLLEAFGVSATGNPAFNKYRMEELGITGKYFQNICHQILGEDDTTDPDYLFFGLMGKADKQQISFDEFLTGAKHDFGYSAEDNRKYFGAYLVWFPNINRELSA